MRENRFTPRAEETLQLAQEAACELGHAQVGTEHLLLAMLRSEGGIACRALTEAGLTADMVRGVIVDARGTGIVSNTSLFLTSAAAVMLSSCTSAVRSAKNCSGPDTRPAFDPGNGHGRSRRPYSSSNGIPYSIAKECA